jgi:hypothetical protein
VRLDRTSAILATMAALASLRAVVKRRDPKAQGLAALAVFAFVGYDRWHDGAWPFRNKARQVASEYGRAK